MLKLVRPVVMGLFTLMGVSSVFAAADFSSFSRDQALEYSQAAIGNTLENIQLLRRDGSRVSIEDYRGKPLVISMIFSSCHHVCPTTTQNLQQVIRKARSVLDDDSFEVLSIGFDTPVDSPQAMAQFRKRSGIDEGGWEFLAGDADNMARLVEQLGFIYYPSPRGFDHLVQASVIDAEGIVYRQVYGMTFPTPVLIEPLKDVVFDRPQPTSTLSYLENRIRLFCTVYDPATDTYHVDVSVFIGTFVGLMVSILFAFVLFKEWRKSIEADQ
jgi:protein SCO1/2